MNRTVRHFATRLKHEATPSRHAAVPAPAPAWERFDRWLALEPVADSVAAHELAMASEDARLAVTLIGQAGGEVVSRIAKARASRRLVNEAAARFTLAFAVARGDAVTRSAALQELAVQR